MHEQDHPDSQSSAAFDLDNLVPPPPANPEAIDGRNASYHGMTSAGWRMITQKYGQCLYGSLLPVAITFSVSYAVLFLLLLIWLSVFGWQPPVSTPPSQLRAMTPQMWWSFAIQQGVQVILTTFLTVPLFAGATLYMADVASRTAKYSTLFTGFGKRYLRLIGVGAVLSLTQAISATCFSLLLPGVVLAVLFSGSWVLIAAAALTGTVLFIGVLWLWGRLLWAVPIAANGFSAGVLDSFVVSWRVTRGRGWIIVGVYIVTTVLAALTVLLCFVGYFLLGIPLLMATLGAAYALIRRDRLEPMFGEQAREANTDDSIQPVV